MQGKGEKFKKKPKHKHFKKKIGLVDLETQEIEELQARYEQVTEVKTFGDLPLSKKTLKGLKEANYKSPTEIQRQAILPALQGKDILGAAITGSGKTLAFLIPVLESLFAKRWTRIDGLGALIITPTRELAYQIFKSLQNVGKFHDFSAALVIGGKNLRFERGRMDQINIVICTPGRILQHMDENPLFDCMKMQILVLDEADRCLDMGFETTMNSIIDNLPTERQTLLFSATQTRSVKDLARLSLNSPTYVAPHEQSEHSTPLNLQQNYVVMELEDKITMLWSFIKTHLKQKVMIFLSTCKQVKYIYEIFCKLRPGTSLLALYGTLHQDRRTAIYEEFVRKRSVVLFATDVASRGLDFPAVNWVIHLDCPEDATAYIHRAGRAARHKAKGESLLVLLPSEEEAMVEELRARRIPINKIEVDSKRMLNPKAKMEAFLAASPELKATAQRAFVSYFKSVAMMKNKEVFKVDDLDPDAYAQSFGLAVTPRVRFLGRLRKKQGKLPVESDDETKDTQPTPTFTSIMASDSEEEENLFTVKRTDHDIEGQDDDVIDLPEISRKRDKKVVTKVAVAKKIGKKKIIPNKKVVFDDDGNIVSNTAKELQSELAKDYQNSATGGIDIDKARELLQEEDKFDKQRFKTLVKQRHQDTKKKLKQKKKDEDESEQDDFGSESDYEPDLSWLPDPDKIYGSKDDGEDEESEEEIHRPPKQLIAKKVGKRQIEEEKPSKKRKMEDHEKPKKKKKKLAKTKELVEDLSLNDAESLAMKLLGS